MIIFKLFLITCGIALPLLIDITKGKTIDADFKLKDLSKISAVLLVYYGISHNYYNTIDITSFYFYLFLKIALTITFIFSVLKYAPLRTAIKRLLSFPRLKRRSTLYFLLIFFFLYTAFFNYRAAEFHADKVKYQTLNILIASAIDLKPFFAIPALILVEIFSAAGEEIVFRYFAINALKNKLDKKWIIIFNSSLIFTLLHWNMSFGIFILGIILGYIFYETESLSLCILIHSMFNLTIHLEIYYIYFKDMGLLKISAYQYVIGLFVCQMFLYHLAEMTLAKANKVFRQT